MLTFESEANPLLSTRVIVESGNDILLLRRAPTGEFKGSWEVPGGKQEPEDTDLFAAARREADQETGLPVEFLETSPQFIEEHPILDGKHLGRQYKAYGFVAVAFSRDFELCDEHTEGMWLPPEKAIKMDYLTPTSYKAIKTMGRLLNARLQIA